MHRKINYISRASQIISFTGLERRRNIAPTDIDGFIDYNGNAFVYMDAKYGDVKLSIGQRKAYENLVKSHTLSGKQSVAFIFRHNTPVGEDVIAKDGLVEEYFSSEKDEWVELKNKWSVLEFIEWFEKYWDSKGINL
tara:strand:- start:7460 stop:7870 length:411 start_codon:yes stop_codon:yes gene_type:complete